MRTRDLLAMRNTGHPGINSLFAKAHSADWDFEHDVDWTVPVAADDPLVAHGWGAYGADFDRAFGNLERFVAAGGTVHYGTDLGNGPMPTGLNRRELEALQGAGVDLVAALRGFLPVDDRLVQEVPAEAPADITIETLLASTVKDRT